MGTTRHWNTFGINESRGNFSVASGEEGGQGKSEGSLGNPEGCSLISE